MIGIGVTTYGDREGTNFAVEQIKKYSKGCRLVKVDQYGIADAKNTCLALLEDCEHIFLFDNDTYPTVVDWHLPYTESGIKHMSYTFNRKVLGFYNQCTIYEKPSGCMLYIHNDCLKAVGGFDKEYKIYGGEHEDYSRRVYNAGLTPYPYMDLIVSKTLIHSMDEHNEVVSSLHPTIRSEFLFNNMNRVNNQVNSKEFKPYK